MWKLDDQTELLAKNYLAVTTFIRAVENFLIIDGRDFRASRLTHFQKVLRFTTNCYYFKLSYRSALLSYNNLRHGVGTVQVHTFELLGSQVTLCAHIRHITGTQMAQSKLEKLEFLSFVPTAQHLSPSDEKVFSFLHIS